MDREPTIRPDPVPPSKLWFGLTASVAAWIALGVGDVLITWWACVRDQPLGGGTVRPGVAVVYFIATLLLLGLAVIAGVLSYRNWKRLTTAARLLEAEGKGRMEFMALTGVFVSFTLGIGLIWLTIPLLILNLCVRVR
jgi:hypothetical protein